VFRVLHEPLPRPLQADKTLRLFNASTALKMAASEVSMHLPAEWRRRLFETSRMNVHMLNRHLLLPACAALAIQRR
jgi:hypothetical protein